MPEERIYVIPLREARKVSRHRRAARAVKITREFLKRHMKSEEIKLDEKLNQRIWKRGIEKPPSRIRVLAVKQDDGSVEVSLAE